MLLVIRISLYFNDILEGYITQVTLLSPVQSTEKKDKHTHFVSILVSVHLQASKFLRLSRH